jgi:cbb3-type cytochrome oxidase subunit 1
METFVRGFVRSSLVWLGVGAALGLWMIFDPGVLAYRPAHMHANLLGFVSMMIFGVAYHILPRFTGNPLSSRRAAMIHLFLANAGLALMVAGFITRVSNAAAGTLLLQAGGVSSTIGIALFITNIWRTITPPRRVHGG